MVRGQVELRVMDEAGKEVLVKGILTQSEPLNIRFRFVALGGGFVPRKVCWSTDLSQPLAPHVRRALSNY